MASFLVAWSLFLGAPPREPALAARIHQLVDALVATDDDKQEEAAQAEAKQIFRSRGLPTIADVGDQAAYELVFLICSPGPPAFRRQVLMKATRAASRQELPRDAALYCEALVRQDRVRAQVNQRPPTDPALRDDIEGLFNTDQAVRQQKDFDLTKMVEMDRQIATRLRAIFDQHGVPTYAMVGTETASHFVVMIQHQSAEFRQRVLPKLKANVDAGQADPGTYAMVYDRSSTDAGRPQRYGENLECNADNPTLHEAPIEDESRVNRRRAELGLMRVELYVRMVVQHSLPVCSAAPAAK